MNNCKLIKFVVIMFVLPIMFASCSNTKQVGYHVFDLTDSLIVGLPELKSLQAVIHPDDILEIRFTGGNPQTAADFNSKGSSYSTSIANTSYLVDPEGNIEIYKLGKVKVAGLTKDQLRDKLIADISKYLIDASVSVRFTNFRFTIVGEVKSPGVFTIPNEKISILEAVAMTGDMTLNARRNAVRVIRDSSGARTIGTVNFNQKTLFTSPYYYLQRNDVVIVERDNKPQGTQVLSTVSSIVGIVASIITLFFIITK